MVSGGLGPHRQLQNFSTWCAKQGYTKLFARLLDHPNITVALGTDYRDLLNRFSAAQVVYTEPADAYFDYRYGKLRYRSSEFRFEHHDTERFEAAPTIYHPTEHSYTRVSEFTQFTGKNTTRRAWCMNTLAATVSPSIWCRRRRTLRCTRSIKRWRTRL